MARPSLDMVRALIERGDARDRAFADAMIRMGWARTGHPGERAQLAALHGALRGAALRSHATLRAEITAETLGPAALRRRFDDVSPFERDHFVEEVLGIAYPPLEVDEQALPPELIAYAPSGYDELVHAFDTTGLGPGDRFVDLGSGLGKGVMLAALLTGAASSGVERDGTLHALAEGASRALGLGGVRYRHGDALEVALEDADVVFMYLPFTGQTLATVMERLRRQVQSGAPRARGRFLCAGALDVGRYPELVPTGPPKSWVHVYEWR